MSKPGYNLRARMAVERLDVLEEDLPRESCHVRGCTHQARYEWASTFGTRWLCSTHRRSYWVHDRILKRIRSFPDRSDILGGE